MRRDQNATINFAHPDQDDIREACPDLCWRTCRDCGYIGLYQSPYLPAARCHECSSADTRLMTKETSLLHGDCLACGGAGEVTIVPTPDSGSIVVSCRACSWYRS